MPEGARVTLDGNPRGTTPAKFELDPGRYPLVLDHPGMERFARDLVVEAGQGEQVFVLGLVPRKPITPPVPPRRVVRIETMPEGARVTLDGNPRGTTPAKFELGPGRYPLVLDHPGMERFARDLVVEAGQGEQVFVLGLVPSKRLDAATARVAGGTPAAAAPVEIAPEPAPVEAAPAEPIEIAPEPAPVETAPIRICPPLVPPVPVCPPAIVPPVTVCPPVIRYVPVCPQPSRPLPVWPGEPGCPSRPGMRVPGRGNCPPQVIPLPCKRRK
jgi:hypothetical protein